MRILLVAGSYPPETGGIAQFMHAFAQGLIARGVEVEVVANPVLPDRGYLRRVEACRQAILARLGNERFDRIVTGSWSPYAVASPLPFDVFCHGMDLLEPSRSLRYRVLMKRTLSQASCVLANSQYTAELAKRFGARSVAVLHPGVDTDRFKPAPGTHTSPVILSLGRLVERKGFDMVLRALPHVIKTFPEVRYVCAGNGPDRGRLHDLARELNVWGHVEWPGDVSEAQKLKLYQSADIFVMPNRIVESEGSVEGFGIVFLEAGACELPVIAGNSGGAPDAVEHEVTGYLVNPTEPAGLSARIVALLSDHNLRRIMGRAARRRTMENFATHQIAERYLRAVQTASA